MLSAAYRLFGDCWFVTLLSAAVLSTVQYSLLQEEVQVLSRCSESRCAALLVSFGRNDSLLLVYPVNQCLPERNTERLLCCFPKTYSRKEKAWGIYYVLFVVSYTVFATVGKKGRIYFKLIQDVMYSSAV